MSISERLKKLQNELKNNQKKDYSDNRFWMAQQDAAGEAEATIRFLPEPSGEDLPFVKLWSHGFQNNGKWFIDNCPTTIGKQCPVCEDNTQHWNDGDAGKEFVRKRGSKRKLSYISNILVVDDPKNPENNGKVFLFKYGTKIHDKIMLAAMPEDEDDEAIDVFDLQQGANFKLKIKKVAGYANFDSSSFKKQSPVENSDEIMKQVHSLKAFVADDQFKSYDELQHKLDSVLGATNVTTRAENITSDEDDSFVIETSQNIKHDQSVDTDDLDELQKLLQDS